MSWHETSPHEFSYWDVIWRHDEKSSWRDWGSYSTEAMARGVAATLVADRPGHEVALRKITKTVEHVDV